MKTDFKLLFCLIVIGLVWGTTYFGISIAIETIPPWYSTALRNTIAALIVFIYLFWNKKFYWIGSKAFKNQIITSVLMLVIANGFTTIAEQTLPTGLTSILSAFNPVVVFLLSLVFNLQKPTLKGFIGVFIGFAGMVFIFKDGLGDIMNPNYKTGVLFLSIAILSWASGTIFVKKVSQNQGTIALNICYQFAIAAFIQIVLAVTLHPKSNIDSWSSRSVLAVFYLAIFGSVLALFCYQYALKRVTPIKVSILTYVNTIIAVFLGWLFKDEIIKSNFIIATILIIVGVFIINYKAKDKKRNKFDLF
jgi:drug/metabolite transporter (DMT)-like permease